MILTFTEWLAISSRLLKLTSDSRLMWDGSPDVSELNNDDSMIFRAEVSGTTYVLGSVDSDGSYPFYLEAWQNKTLFDRVVSPSTNRATSDETLELRAVMRELYRGAFRSHFGAQERAAALIADLDDFSS